MGRGTTYAAIEEDRMTAPAKPNPIPDSYRRITPCLTIQGAAKALEFYAAVFGATDPAAAVTELRRLANLAAGAARPG